MKAVHAVLLFAVLTGAASCAFTRKYIFVYTALDWHGAQTYCRTHYVDLSTINSVSEMETVSSYLNKASWIGLSGSLRTDQAQWSDGSDLEFAAWQTRYSIKGDFFCAYLYKSAFVKEDCLVSLPFCCYKWEPEIIVVQQMMNWEGALKFCRTHYTDLVSLTSKADLHSVRTVIRNNESASLWTGLRFLDGLWFWVNQEPLENLVTLSPCPARPFHCGALKVNDYTLETRNCNENMAFICYK
ncbi:C-type lectin domain family 2 member L [Bagarius yarrelli]|uniref:C-type lectin domain family 2 member L n=1 Tax=Bagarius yarrelli TaxID=175774 RepID=A0A556TWI0_BAGYA|nr:C-type lectin domain family 2 member L [Bagarius yarrelli]